METIRSEDTRIEGFKQVVFCFCAALALILVAPARGHATGRLVAEPPVAGLPAASIVAVPADGNARGIRLRTLNLTTTLFEDTSGAWADTGLRLELYNPGKTAVVLPLGLPGLQPEPAAMPQIVSATAGASPLALAPIAAPDRPGVQATASVTIPVKASVDIAIRYRQPLAIRDSVAGYTYMLTAANVWAGAPESTRVVITFAQDVSSERIMHLAPAAQQVRPGEFVWEWEGRKAPSNIGLAWLANSAWAELVAERSAAATSPGFAEHAALARRYWRLSTLPAPAFAPRASYYHRYVYQSIAEWRAAIAAAASSTDAVDLATANEQLAGAYLALGSRDGGAAAQSYLQLASDHLEKAAALNPADPELGASAVALQERLAEEARRRDDGMSTAGREARVRALGESEAAPAADDQARRSALVLAQAALDTRNLALARERLEGGYGEQVMALPDAGPPQIVQALVDVRTTARSRVIVLRILDEAQGDRSAALIGAAQAALRDLAPLAASRDALTLTLGYDDAPALLAWQERLAAAVPARPELAILADVLSPRRMAFPAEEESVTRQDRYVERVDLTGCAAAWEREAAKLEAAAAQTQGPDPEVGRIRAALWREDAGAWRNLARSSRATYRVEIAERGDGPDWLVARLSSWYTEGAVRREWVVPAGQARQLEAAVRSWHYDRAVVAGAALLAAPMVMLLGVLLLRRSATSRAVRRGASEVDRTPQEHV